MLTLEETIVDTHDDYTPWADCVVGFNNDGDFVIRYNFINYEIVVIATLAMPLLKRKMLGKLHAY